MSENKSYLQEKIIGNPGQMLIVSNTNILSLTEYMPSISKLIKVTAPANSYIYATYSDVAETPMVHGILKYKYLADISTTGNISASLNIDKWMKSNNQYNTLAEATFTYDLVNNCWRDYLDNMLFYPQLINIGITFAQGQDTPINGSTIVVKANYEQSMYYIYPPTLGTWVITCQTTSGFTTRTLVINNQTNTYDIVMSIFKAFISVNYTLGATCSVYNQDNDYTMTAPQGVGFYTFEIPYSGIWIVTINQDFPSASDPNITYTKERTKAISATIMNQVIEVDIELISSVLEECTWEEIKYVADMHMGDKYWKIGDCKSITLNGTLTPYFNFMNTTYYAFIIDFDHCISNNSTGIVETETGGITFEIGRLSPDSNVDTMISESNPKQFPHTTGDYTSNIYMLAQNIVYGWAGAEKMHIILDTLYNNIIPTELKNVIKKTNKYTDNLGYNSGNSGWQSGAVTGTEESLFLLSPYEMNLTPYSSVSYNPDEANHQVPYPYYTASQNASRKVKYRYTYSSFTAEYFNTWLRSPSNADHYFTVTSRQNNQPVYSHVDGNCFTVTYDSPGICPCFVVGSEDPAS